MSRTFKGAVLLAAAVGLWQASAGANGGSAPAPPPSSGGSGSGMTAMTPAELAIEAFKSGDGHRLKGRKLEEESVTKKGADLQKSEVKARGEFEKSLKDFQKAAELNPQLFQAYNGMGYAYRKTGDYAKALEMYDRAIGMAPGFYPEAVEYRGEAYLALNRIDDARKAYLDLFAADRKQADALMAAMKTWVTARRANPSGVDAAAILPVPGARYMIASPLTQARELWERVERVARPVGYPAWQWLTIRAGVPVVTPVTTDQWVPQMANLDALGGINFQKGCYTGQEIVARTQYLGRLKERLFLLHAEDGPVPLAGERLYSSTFGDQACGTVVSAAAAPGGGSDLLAVIQIAAAASGDVHLARAGGGSTALTLLDLPYALPPAAAPRTRIA